MYSAAFNVLIEISESLSSSEPKDFFYVGLKIETHNKMHGREAGGGGGGGENQSHTISGP